MPSLNAISPFEVAGYSVDPALLRISHAGVDTRLESRVMQVLVYLAEHAGQVVSRDELEQRLWPGRIVTEDAVTNAVGKLRRAFKDSARLPRVIETVPKCGYRLIAPVQTLVASPSNSEETPNANRPAQGSTWTLRPAWKAGALTIFLLCAMAWGYFGEEGLWPGQDESWAGKPAVAVLPFSNIGESPEQDYFANGVTTDLITDLSKVSGLLIVAPGSVFVYRDGAADARTISAELDVDYLIMGSIQRMEQRLRINVRLIDARHERTLWGERYDGAMKNVFEVQDKVVAAVIVALKIELAPREKSVLAKRATDSVEAYDYYLRGLEEHAQRSMSQNRSAINHFKRATELDPGFARAYAGLALAYSRDAIDGWTEEPSKSLELARSFALKAAGMDAQLPQVHFVSGQIHLFSASHSEAILAVHRAIHTDPNYADAYALNAWILNYAGRPRQALKTLEKAMRLNPRPPASYLEILGEIQFVQNQYAESAATFQRVLGINPAYTRARMWNAAALALVGDREGAQWEADELLLVNPDFQLSRLRFSFPFKDPREWDILLDGLSSAGLPE